jgi:hypothetical protein
MAVTSAPTRESDGCNPGRCCRCSGIHNPISWQGAEMTRTNAGTAWAIGHCSINTGRRSDPRLAAVLDGKPPADEVPTEAWWHLADSLQHAVSVRREREGVELLDSDDLKRETYKARWSAQAALAHLGQGAAIRPVADRREKLTVRTSIRDLAKLIVSARPTPMDKLRGAVLNHLEALGSPES